MDALKKINWKQPKYMIPLIIYFPLLFVGYFVIDLFHTEKAEIPDGLTTTEYLLHCVQCFLLLNNRLSYRMI